jgi:hypothetical protein
MREHDESDSQITDPLLVPFEHSGSGATAFCEQIQVPVHKPYVPDDEKTLEITLRAVVLSVLLAVLLGAANVYLGLFAGLTVSASIPAAM